MTCTTRSSTPAQRSCGPSPSGRLPATAVVRATPGEGSPADTHTTAGPGCHASTRRHAGSVSHAAAHCMPRPPPPTSCSFSGRPFRPPLLVCLSHSLHSTTGAAARQLTDAHPSTHSRRPAASPTPPAPLLGALRSPAPCRCAMPLTTSRTGPCPPCPEPPPATAHQCR